MPSVFKHELSVYGTEKDFMAAVINYLTGSQSPLYQKIVCSSDIDTEYSDSDLTHIPSFDFSINGKIDFSITRKYALSSSAWEFNITSGSVSNTLSWGGSPSAWDSTATRKIFISYIVDDNFVLLSINGTYQNGAISNANINFVYCKNSTKSYQSVINNVQGGGSVTIATIFNISSRVFYEVDGTDSGTFMSRFSYQAPAGEIDYIKSSIYGNGTNKEFEVTSVYDCTTVNVGDTVSLKDGAYLAVGTHQIVKV